MRAREMVAMLAIGVLALTGCSDDGDDDGGSASASSPAEGTGELTRADGEAFVAALTAGTAESEAYITCVADEVKAAVDAGDFSADDVRSWTDGAQLDSALQEYITSIEVVGGCYEKIAATTTAVG